MEISDFRRNSISAAGTMICSLTSFSQTKNNSDVVLENNTLKYVGNYVDGQIRSFEMVVKYKDGLTSFVSNNGGPLTDEMINAINNLSKYYNDGEATQVVFKNILMSSGKSTKDLKPVRPYIKEFVF